MMNWDTSFSTAFTPLNFNYSDSSVTSDTGNNITVSTPDPLIDWLPNSCLYTKYVPTWHLIRSYK